MTDAFRSLAEQNRRPTSEPMSVPQPMRVGEAPGRRVLDGPWSAPEPRPIETQPGEAVEPKDEAEKIAPARSPKTKGDLGVDFSDFLGWAKPDLTFRPVKFVRRADYPKVTVDGCKFRADGGGFSLRQRDSGGGKIVGFFQKKTIEELEERYGGKPNGKGKRKQVRSRRGNRDRGIDRSAQPGGDAS